MKKLIALLLAAMMICGVLAGCTTSAPASDPTTTAPTTEATDPTTEPTDPVVDPEIDEPEVDEPENDEPEVDDPTEEDPVIDINPNATYEEIFSRNNIVDAPSVFIGLDSMSFAMESAGIVEKIELGYKDDIVSEMVNVVYYPVADLTEDDKALLDSTMQSAMSIYTDLACCSDSTFNMGDNYYIISLTFSGLDNADNAKLLADQGLLAINEDTGLYSAAASETNLAESGYIKK